jgi:hypothetical protein
MKEIKIRSMIVAPKDHVIISADFSQAESWIVMALSKDPKMEKSLKYGDIHTETAANIILFPNSKCPHTEWNIETGFPFKKQPDGSLKCIYSGCVVGSDSRYTGKRLNHGTSYRMGFEKQASVINKDSDKPPYITISLNQSQYYSQNWKRYYANIPGVWWPNIEEQLRINRTITNCYGHRFIHNGNWGDELFRQATAEEPQSTVACHANGVVHPELGIEGGFLSIYKHLLGKGVERITNVSHDSIVVEVVKSIWRDIAGEIYKYLHRPIVCNGQEFTIPVDIEVGERWGELEKVKI